MAKRASTSSTSAAHGSVDASMRLIVLHGKETFLHEEHARRLREALNQVHGEVETFHFHGETVDLAAVLDELRSYGLMQTHKIVIVDEADAFIGRGENAAYRRAMERYAENPVEHATLVLRAATWRPGNFDKLVAKVGAVIKCDIPSDAQASAWCIKRANAAHGFTLEPNAATVLVDRLGPSLSRLDTELAKLGAMSPAGTPIGVAQVTEAVGRSREEQAWDIQEPVLAGDAGEALGKLRELIDISRAPNELLMWSLTDLARKLHAAARLLNEGASPGAVAKEVRLWGATLGPILDAARSVPPETLAQLLRECIRADRRMKTGRATPERSLEGLTVLMADTLAVHATRR